MASIFIALSDALQSSKDRAGTAWTATGVDDQELLVRAFQALTPGIGGSIEVSEGNGYFSAGLEPPRGVYIFGQGASFGGAKVTTLHLVNGANCDMFTYRPQAQSMNACGLRRLTLDGNKAGQPVGSTSRGIVITTPVPTPPNTAQPVDHLTFSEIMVDQFKSHAVAILPISRGIDTIHFNDCHLSGCDGDGFFVDTTPGWTLWNTRFSHGVIGLNRHNIHIIDSFQNGIRFVDNDIDQANQHGVLLEGATSCLLVGNTISSSSNSGGGQYDNIHLKKAPSGRECLYCLISDNEFWTGGLTRYHINLQDASDYITIGPQTYGPPLIGVINRVLTALRHGYIFPSAGMEVITTV